MADDMLRFAMLDTPSADKVLDPIVTDEIQKILRSATRPQAYEGSLEQHSASEWCGEKVPSYGPQWECVFEDGAMFKHGHTVSSWN